MILYEKMEVSKRKERKRINFKLIGINRNCENELQNIGYTGVRLYAFAVSVAAGEVIENERKSYIEGIL